MTSILSLAISTTSSPTSASVFRSMADPSCAPWRTAKVLKLFRNALFIAVVLRQVSNTMQAITNQTSKASRLANNANLANTTTAPATSRTTAFILATEKRMSDFYLRFPNLSTHLCILWKRAPHHYFFQLIRFSLRWVIATQFGKLCASNNNNSVSNWKDLPFTSYSGFCRIVSMIPFSEATPNDYGAVEIAVTRGLGLRGVLALQIPEIITRVAMIALRDPDPAAKVESTNNLVKHSVFQAITSVGVYALHQSIAAISTRVSTKVSAALLFATLTGAVATKNLSIFDVATATLLTNLFWGGKRDGSNPTMTLPLAVTFGVVGAISLRGVTSELATVPSDNYKAKFDQRLGIEKGKLHTMLNGLERQLLNRSSGLYLNIPTSQRSAAYFFVPSPVLPKCDEKCVQHWHASYSASNGGSVLVRGLST
eukprot:PhF_6_TR22212/c0_g2_i1/m.31362